MFQRIMSLLNVKLSEAGLVKRLFLVQFSLGIATAFLYVGSLTLFLTSFEKVKQLDKISLLLPKAFILAAILVTLFNLAYSYIEKHYSPVKVLQLVTVFSGASVLIFWLGIVATDSWLLPFVLAAWNVVIYILVGTAFWGLASLLFNVRESRRLFSIVGAGDIPAKMLGYLAVTVLVPFIGAANLLWISIAAFAGSLWLIKNFGDQISYTAIDEHVEHHHTTQSKNNSFSRIIERLFQNRLIFSASLMAVLASIVFSFVDFTFLSQIKIEFKHEHEIGTFVAIFFAAGRILAILVKLLLSSRVITKLGMANALLITPLILLLIDGIVVFSLTGEQAHLYVFGLMVLLMEILRSTVQDPVFLVLFQPLNPHDRLKGHIIAKGYTLPVALLIVGSFLIVYQSHYQQISISLISKIILVFLLLWAATIYLIKSDYMQTLIQSLKKGYFTGHELFLNDQAVTDLLLQKAQSSKPLEVIHALNLLERSGYPRIIDLLLLHLQSNDSSLVKDYVTDRMIQKNSTAILPIIQKKIEQRQSIPSFYKALFYLGEKDTAAWQKQLTLLNGENKKAALLGLLFKRDEEAHAIVQQQLLQLAQSNNIDDNILANTIIAEAGAGNFTDVLHTLLQHSSVRVYQKAMEAAGKVKDISIFSEVLQTALQHQAYYAFQQSLTHYGDDIFDDDYLAPKALPAKLLPYIIKAAAKVRGPKSETYLIVLLKDDYPQSDAVIKALWMRKANLSNHQVLIESWISKRLDNMRVKMDCAVSLYTHARVQLLEQALLSELQLDMQVVLKAFALIYDRERINRFIEIYHMQQAAKVANAMELLELTIPKKYFTLLNQYIDILQDISSKQPILNIKNRLPVKTVVNQVLGSTNGLFNSWSKSVALYLLPQLHTTDFALPVGNVNNKDDDALLQETRNYVFSILK